MAGFPRDVVIEVVLWPLDWLVRVYVPVSYLPAQHNANSGERYLNDLYP